MLAFFKIDGENYFIKVDHLLKNYVQQQGGE